MTKLIIEKNIQIPEVTRRGGFRSKFADMEVGDSVFALGKDSRSLAPQASNWGRTQNPPRKFTQRQIDGGIRVWRIA